MPDLLYLASPYSSPDSGVQEKRFDAACIAAGILMQAGYFVFSPIAHTHPIALRSFLPTQFAYWEAYDRHMIALCNRVVVYCLPEWAESKGVQAEIQIALALNKPISFLKEQDLSRDFIELKALVEAE